MVDVALFTVLGGVGLFIIGMGRMTDALRSLAGNRARVLAQRLAGRPLSAVLTGTVVAGLIQSSSATLVLALGLVGAGVLTLTQGIGIALGANIGTTLTGWMVLLVGVKLQLGVLALPLLFVAALTGAVSQGRMARVAAAASGFALVFIGLDLIDRGVAGAEAGLLGGVLPPAAGMGWVWLILLGALTTAIIQASSAGLAALLVLLGSGDIGLDQAIALTIGLNIGANMTPVLAAIGGSVEMRRTVLANVIFNVASGVAVGLVVVPVARLFAALPIAADPQAALVAFHTTFNILGVVAVLPAINGLTRLVVWLVPDKGVPLTRRLDPGAQGDPAAAFDLATAVLTDAARLVWHATAQELSPDSDHAAAQAACARADRAAEALQDYLTGVAITAGDQIGRDRYAALLHGVDHLHRLAHRAAMADRTAALRATPFLRRQVAVLRGTLVQVLDDPAAMPRAARRLEKLEHLLAATETRLRRDALVRQGALSAMTPADVLNLWDQLRWLRRSTAHAAGMMRWIAAAQNGRA